MAAMIQTTGSLGAAHVTRRTQPAHVPAATRQTSRASDGATALVLAWGALSFGAVYPWAYWPLAAGCLVSGVSALMRRSRAPRVPDRLTAAALAAVGIVMIVQIVPLPIGLLATLSPRAGGVLSELDILFAAGAVERRPLSIAPAATRTALALYVALAVMMLGVARSVSASGPRRLAGLVAALGVVLAVIGIVQRPFYDGRIYGFWTPLMQGSPFGPFVNKNHFAGWMLMALPLTFGLLCANVARAMPRAGADWRHRIVWLSSAQASQVMILAGAAAVMALSLVLTMSRSGILAFAASVAMTGWWATRRLTGSRRLVLAAYFAGVVILVIVGVGADTLMARFGSADPATVNERLPIWRDTWRIIGDFWLTGTGVNTYGVATLFYQTSVPGFHLREAHNDYLQVAAEGGLLVGLPVLCLMAALTRDIRRRFADSRGSNYWIRLGAVTGLVAIALQSIVDFSLQMPGNAALCAVLFGIALHVEPRTTAAPLLPS